MCQNNYGKVDDILDQLCGYDQWGHGCLLFLPYLVQGEATKPNSESKFCSFRINGKYIPRFQVLLFNV